MPSKYGVNFSDFLSSTAVKTAIRFSTGTNKPLEIVELVMTGGGTTAPADLAHEASFMFLNNNAAGTGTAQTPEKFDQADPAAGATVNVSFSAEPTTYASVAPLLWGFNQRGGMRWSVPQGEGVSLGAAQTNMNGGFRVRSSAAGNVSGHAHFWERA